MRRRPFSRSRPAPKPTFLPSGRTWGSPWYAPFFWRRSGGSRVGAGLARPDARRISPRKSPRPRWPCYEADSMSQTRLALSLPGGGVTGGLYQIGALSALEDTLEGLDARGFDLYVGASSGATVAAALAGGLPVQRLYRALLDPADDYFPLERSHLVRTDLDEWRRTLVTAFGALRSSVHSLTSRTPAPKDLWEQLDRFYDSLPAGLFTLDAFERFLEEFFLRRGVSTSFPGLART